MKIITATELKTRTSEAIQCALKAPVRIERNGQAILVMLSAEEYERLLCKNAAERKPFPFDSAKDDQLVPAGDEWWQPMSEEEFLG